MPNAKNEKSPAEGTGKRDRRTSDSAGKRTSDPTGGICPVARTCGGCAFAGVPYAEQLKKKEKRVRDLLSSLCEVRPIVGADPACFYRNKVHWAYGWNGKKVFAGRYAEGSHRIIENDICLLEDQECQRIQSDIRKMAAKFKIPAYDERTKTGLLRRVLVRKGMATGEVMVVLVLSSAILPGKKAFIKLLLEKHPSIKTVLINVNTRTDSMILGGKTINEFGRGFIWDEILGVRFKISPESFFQINHGQTEKLYTLAIDAASLRSGEKVLDAYCGTGSIGLCAAASMTGGRGSSGEKSVFLTGVEMNRAAVSDARENAKANPDLGKARFIAADATEYMLDAAARGEKYDVVILDPPRAGTTPEFISACETLAPNRIVYVSCDPQTLARDLREFGKHGYDPQYVTPLDMLPMTEHIESCCLLKRRGGA